MISTDRNIFDNASPVAERMISYGESFGELHIIVFSLKNNTIQESFSLSDKVFVYPTHSSSRLSFINDAIAIGTSIISTIYFGQTVISTQDPFETGIVGIFLKKKTHTPLQMQIHTDFHSKGFYDSSLLNWVRFQIGKRTLKYADGIRVVREKIKQDLISFYGIKPQKITVLPIFVDIERFSAMVPKFNLKEKYPQFKNIILVASRLSFEKNIETILRAFAQVSVRVQESGLIIVGDGPRKKYLEKLAKRLGISHCVIFEGWQNDVASYFSSADLFVNASFFEGYGMSIVEAISFGCPVLTSSVGIAQDILKDGHNALVCYENMSSCFTNKMITFFSNPSMRASISSTAHNDIRKHALSKEVYISQYNESFANILNKV